MGKDWKVGLRKAELRKILGRMAAVAGLLLVCSGSAWAGNLCFTIGSRSYVGIGAAIPGKGACKQFSLIGPSTPGYLAMADLCKSSDGTTLLFTAADGFFSGPETIQGTFDVSSLTGSAQDCEAPAGSATFCDAITLSLAKCSPAKQPIPATSSDSMPNSGRKDSAD